MMRDSLDLAVRSRGLQRLDFRYYWSTHGPNTRYFARAFVPHIIWTRPIPWERTEAAPGDREGSKILLPDFFVRCSAAGCRKLAPYSCM